ncbi:Retrovirus-related Pol polyprotein from transposon 297 [Eumeta japonica]|uniref:Retrovirus-related Pol polyprotein from transposon 297 n=1 Tax=Eumeta variegata TaxID=151549 RepID=A0A4C1UKC0_EUMVA|nr:Retrovirus-related Pol polyprotein from transposon 297 [Eumeta japonica]
MRISAPVGAGAVGVAPSPDGLLRERDAMENIYIHASALRKTPGKRACKLSERSWSPQSVDTCNTGEFHRGSACVDIERILSSFISTDYIVDQDPDVVPFFYFNFGSVSDSDSGVDTDFYSMQNIHNSTAAPPPETYNEFFHLRYRSTTSLTSHRSVCTNFALLGDATSLHLECFIKEFSTRRKQGDVVPGYPDVRSTDALGRTPDGHIFAIPVEYQPASLHPAVTNTSSYIKIKKTLNKRHQTRKIWIALTDEISKTYLDEAQNLQFNDYYLEEIMENTNDCKSLPISSNQNLEKLLEKLLEEKQSKSETQNLGKISKDFMIDKFTEVRKSIDTGTLIDLIALGLPNYLTDKIDRETLQETEDLYNELGDCNILLEGINVKTPNVLDDRRNKDVSSYSDVSKQDINRCEVNFNEHINLDEFEIVVDHLDLHQQAEIDTLLRKYKSVFAKDKYDVGTVRDYEAHIDLMVDKYCAKRPYRCTVNDRKEIEDQVSQLLKMKLIEESYSPFAAPVTLAYKKEDDKKTRLCIDFRELNKIVVPQSQPFPLIEDLMIKTVDCKYFSTFDINSAFWSIPLKVQDRCSRSRKTRKLLISAGCKSEKINTPKQNREMPYSVKGSPPRLAPGSALDLRLPLRRRRP